jgi:hypothetical protein
VSTRPRVASRAELESLIERRAKGEQRDGDPDLTDAELMSLARQVGFSERDLAEALRTTKRNSQTVEAVRVERHSNGVSVLISAPGITWYIAGRLAVYGCAVAFVTVALASSGFTLVAWLATVPFLLIGIGALVRMLILARTIVRIDIGQNECSVRASALGLSRTMVSTVAKTFARGPLIGGSLGLQPVLFRLPFLRIVGETGDIDIGHGSSERDIRIILRALGPFIAGVEEKE